MIARAFQHQLRLVRILESGRGTTRMRMMWSQPCTPAWRLAAHADRHYTVPCLANPSTSPVLARRWISSRNRTVCGSRYSSSRSSSERIASTWALIRTASRESTLLLSLAFLRPASVHMLMKCMVTSSAIWVSSYSTTKRLSRNLGENDHSPQPHFTSPSFTTLFSVAAIDTASSTRCV